MRNSVLIREVNERITDLSAWQDGEPRELLCECGDESCIEAIRVTKADYQAARKGPRRYLVASKHDGEGATTLVTARDRYSIVRYRDSPA
jgi:hypothetical protein